MFELNICIHVTVVSSVEATICGEYNVALTDTCLGIRMLFGQDGKILCEKYFTAVSWIFEAKCNTVYNFHKCIMDD
jgi:hypothetical protein